MKELNTVERETERGVELKAEIIAEVKRIKKTLPSLKLRKVVDNFLAKYKKLHVELKKLEALRSVIKNKKGCKVEVHTVLGVKYPDLNERKLDEAVIEILSELKEVYSGEVKRESEKAVKERLKNESYDLKRLIDVTKLTVRNISEEKEVLITSFAGSEDDILDFSEPSASDARVDLPAPLSLSSSTSPLFISAPLVEGSVPLLISAPPLVEGSAPLSPLSPLSAITGVKESGDVVWVQGLPLIKIEGNFLLDFRNFNRNVGDSIKTVWKVIASFNLFKNKAFHSELGDLPLIESIAGEFFKYKNSKGEEVVKHPEGDPFVNEWVYNLLLLNIFTWAERVLDTGVFSGDEEEDLKELVSELLGRLHPSIKKALATRGLKIYLNLYAGFDCEYERVRGTFKKNELLSMQLAGNSSVYFKVPSKYIYVMEYINPSTSKSSDIIVKGARKEEFKLRVEKGINALLDERDELKRGSYWRVIKEINAVISSVEEVRKNEGFKEYILYELPFTEVREYIKINEKALEKRKKLDVRYIASKEEETSIESGDFSEVISGEVSKEALQDTSKGTSKGASEYEVSNDELLDTDRVSEKFSDGELEKFSDGELEVEEDEASDDELEDYEEEEFPDDEEKLEFSGDEEIEEDRDGEEEEEEEKELDDSSDSSGSSELKFTADELIKTSNDILVENVDFNIEQISKVLLSAVKRVNGETDDEKLKSVTGAAFSKRSSRFLLNFSDLRISVSTERNLFLAAHYSPADLSFITDFDLFKEKLDIVQKSFVTRGRPLISFKEDWQSRLFIRDTALLSPPKSQSLKAIGKMHGEEFHKIDLRGYRGRMLDLLVENPILFKAYAIQDSKITLKHINEMSKRYFTLGKIGVPLTLSAMSKEYIFNEWGKIKYPGFQIHAKYPLGNFGKISSPKGLQIVGDVGLYLSKYSASFRGGRNESFMYGAAEGKWIDYDLTSAYTTAMCILGDPVYKELKLLNQKQLEKYPTREFFLNYMAMEVVFEFPEEVKYPCIPQNVDEFTAIYPRTGKSVITGFEYLLAKNLGCKFKKVHAVSIPFKARDGDGEEVALKIPLNYRGELDDENVKKEGEFLENLMRENIDLLNAFSSDAPFINIENKIQAERRKHPKGTFNNLFFKLIGNAGFGLVCQGLGSKRKFDIKTKGMTIMSAGELSNPIIAASITGFIRAVIAETLNNIEKMGGRVISVTTDGFITDVENLEEKLLALEDKYIPLLKYYRIVRRMLSKDPAAFEEKNVETRGILSWTTRGQVGRSESGIIATTGFQSQGISRQKLYTVFYGFMADKREVVYIQTSLSGAKAVYEEGGNVALKYNDQSFSLIYDNKRRIISEGSATGEGTATGEGIDKIALYDSAPWKDVNICRRVRGNVKLVKTSIYNKYLSRPGGRAYQNPVELGVRAFVRWLIINKLLGVEFNTYPDIIDFVKRGIPSGSNVRISKASISNLKSRIEFTHSLENSVPNLPEVKAFFEYVEKHIPRFEGKKLLKEEKS